MATAFAPDLFFQTIPGLFGLALTATGEDIVTLALYAWLSLCMAAAWLTKLVQNLIRQSARADPDVPGRLRTPAVRHHIRLLHQDSWPHWSSRSRWPLRAKWG